MKNKGLSNLDSGNFRNKAETYKMLLEFADVSRTELTDTMIYIEFKPKKDQVLQQAQRQ